MNTGVKQKADANTIENKECIVSKQMQTHKPSNNGRLCIEQEVNYLPICNIFNRLLVGTQGPFFFWGLTRGGGSRPLLPRS